MADRQPPATRGARAVGLRDRKKHETRRRIAAVAARLFASRGYDAVRMTDVAEAADVSPQTLYNYFPTKEHLVFDEDRELAARLVRLVTDRAPGVTLAEAVRLDALAFLDEATRHVEKDTGLAPAVILGPGLRRVWIEMNARNADQVAEALYAREQARGLARQTATLVARAIVAVFAIVLEEVGRARLEGRGRASIGRELRVAIHAMTEVLEHGTATIEEAPARRRRG